MTKVPKLSIAIPTSSMLDGSYYLRRLLDSLWIQTYQDFEIIITDNSEDSTIEGICREYKEGITYYRNPIKGMAQNTNEAIRRSTGDLIKIIYMDDYFSHNMALERIANHFKGHWLVTSCRHTIDGELFYNTHHPYYSDDIHTGNNTIGSPSVLTIKNRDPMFFDEELTWLLDCDYYKRMHEKYGEPTILRDINVNMGIHEGQATNTMGDQRKLLEFEYMRNKYARN